MIPSYAFRLSQDLWMSDERAGLRTGGPVSARSRLSEGEFRKRGGCDPVEYLQCPGSGRAESSAEDDEFAGSEKKESRSGVGVPRVHGPAQRGVVGKRDEGFGLGGRDTEVSPCRGPCGSGPGGKAGGEAPLPG